MKHLLKFYRKGTAFLMAFCLMALLFSFSCAAAENTTTYRFSDINLEVQVPSELIGFTRSVTSNNAYLDLIGTDDVEELRSLMVVNHVYLEAVPQDVRYELIISGKEAGSASTDFTELSDTDLDSLFNEYLQKSDAIDNESVTENITASAIEHVNGIPYFVTSVKSVANNQVTVYMKKYYTVMQGNAISFFIQSNGEEIDSATAQLLTEVVTSAQYKTIHKSILENAFFTEILASVVTLAVPILLLALIIRTRVKSPASIFDKMQRKGFEVSIQSIVNNLNDVAGVRVVCPFISDIYAVANMLISQDDVEVMEVKDYIKNPKPNGYRSLHYVVIIPIYLSSGKEYMKVEVQIRTIAMNFWASLEHQMHYKQFGNEEMPEIVNELTVCADTIYNTDVHMQEIREEIHRLEHPECLPVE